MQSVGLLQCVLEGAGLKTVSLSLIPALTELVGAPRALAVRFPFGAPFGDPGNGWLQRAVLREALALLDSADAPRTLVHSRLVWRQREPREDDAER